VGSTSDKKFAERWLRIKKENALHIKTDILPIVQLIKNNSPVSKTGFLDPGGLTTFIVILAKY